jgi:hypothetical protein
MALAALGTLGAIVVAALIFALLAMFDVQRAFDPIFNFVLAVIGKVMFVILTPIFWIVNWLLEHIFGRGIPMPQALQRIREEGVPQQKDSSGHFIPTWALQAIRVLVVAGAVWLLYRASRLLFDLTRRGRTSEQRDEVRTSTGGGGGLGSLLQGLFGGRSHGTLSGDWLRRHAVYRLYARLVSDAHERGIERGQGDTPIEFAEHAGGRLDAPPFGGIGLAFDRARYGRHYPSKESVDSLERALREWERHHQAGGAGDTTERS